jgi:hypothetical protein
MKHLCACVAEKVGSLLQKEPCPAMTRHAAAYGAALCAYTSALGVNRWFENPQMTPAYGAIMPKTEIECLCPAPYGAIDYAQGGFLQKPGDISGNKSTHINLCFELSISIIHSRQSYQSH